MIFLLCQQVFQFQGSHYFSILLNLLVLWEYCLMWCWMFCLWHSRNREGKLAFALAEFHFCGARKPWLTLEAKWIFNLDYNIVLNSLWCFPFPFFPLGWTDISFIFRMKSKEHIQFRLSQHRDKNIIQNYLPLE